MEALHLPDNIKVHFAGCEGQQQYIALHELGIAYGLYTAFPFVSYKVFGKKVYPIMPLKWMKQPEIDIPRYVCNDLKHVIQDSGLFTLMFGSHNGKKDENLVNRWYDGLVEFTLNHSCNVTCVEVDCQKILGVDKAWEFRERMKKDLPNNRIINVFHVEDGKYGLDRMIEFSEYIAISVPELRILNLKNYVPVIAKYIKNKKPEIDIHLLGCTELKLLEKCKFCTSSDSTTWTASKRYGFLCDRHISEIQEKVVKDFVGETTWSNIHTHTNAQNTNTLCLTIELLKRQYEQYAGNQDYIKR